MEDLKVKGRGRTFQEDVGVGCVGRMELRGRTRLLGTSPISQNPEVGVSMGAGTMASRPGVAGNFHFWVRAVGSSAVTVDPNEKVGNCVRGVDVWGRKAWTEDGPSWLLES